MLEGSDAGKIISQFCDAAFDSLEVCAKKGLNQFGLTADLTAGLLLALSTPVQNALIP
jgi:hypothetical protein